MKKILTVAFSLAMMWTSLASACDDDKKSAEVSKEPTLELTSHDANKAVFTVKGMMCTSCKQKIEASLKKLDGVSAVNFDLKHKRAEISYVASKVDTASLIKAIQSAGFEAKVAAKN